MLGSFHWIMIPYCRTLLTMCSKVVAETVSAVLLLRRDADGCITCARYGIMYNAISASASTAHARTQPALHALPVLPKCQRNIFEKETTKQVINVAILDYLPN